MRRFQFFVAGIVLWAVQVEAQPRERADMITGIQQVEDIRRALLERINVDDEAERIATYPNSDLHFFDRDRDGSFYTEAAAFGLYDYAMAIVQYTHDDADLDSDGVPGFIELECERAGGPLLDPNEAQTAPGTPDGDTDCDGDGISNIAEIVTGLDPLDGSDALRDSDHDGVSDFDEIAAGTRHLPVLSLRVADISDQNVTVEIVMDQDAPEYQPVLAEFLLVSDPGQLEYESTTLGAASLAAGGKSPFGNPLGDGRSRSTMTSTNLTPVGSGVLLNIRFRRVAGGPSTITFDLDNSRLSPVAARREQSFGVGHPDEPLIVGGE